MSLSTRQHIWHQATVGICSRLNSVVPLNNMFHCQGTLLCTVQCRHRRCSLAIKIMMEVNSNIADQVTASGTTDAPQVAAVVNKKLNPCKPLFLKLGAWNVRTTNDSDSSTRPERATAIICKELEKASIDICALSEVRRPGTGNLVEKSHTIFWSGGDKKQAGVGFAIRNELLNQYDLNPTPRNDRISTLRIKLKENSHILLVSVYGPTMQRTQEEKEQFYEQLGDVLDDARNDSIIVLGDLNARVGKDWTSWPSVIGKYGVGNMNSNGLILLEFCSRYQLSIMGTMFQMKNSLKTTWQHPRSKHFHQIDHVLANSHARQYINVTKIDPIADCFTDHKLLVTKCFFKIQPKNKGLKPPKKYDITLTTEKKQRLQSFLNEKLLTCEHDWEDFKSTLQEAAKHTFDQRKKVSQDWFDDNDVEIQRLLKDRHLNRNELRDQVRRLKNQWFHERATEAERYAQSKNHREFYAAVNKVYGPRSKANHPVRSKNDTLLTSSPDIKDRWIEHFSELLNQPTDVDQSLLHDIEQLPIDESLDLPITEEELDTALKNTKLGKSPGPDGILPEVLVHGGNTLKAFLFSIISIFWFTENLPSEIKDPNITILFKKGDRSQCGNYRGISLLSVVGKLFADILLQRLKRVAEKVYPQSQSGYRESRSTIDGIFTLRQLIEKTKEQRQQMYIVFVDFTKAFDTVNREFLFKILGKLGCPSKFIRLVEALYTQVNARLIIDGVLTEPFQYNSGVKQGCKLAPTLYGIYAAVLLLLAYDSIAHQFSIKIRFRYDGEFFDLKRLKAKTKTFIAFIREAQYADDIAIFSDSAIGLQTLLTAYNNMAKRMGLSINIKQTETMSIGPEELFFIDDTQIQSVNRFKYLGSIVTSDGSVNTEIITRIQALSAAYGRLRDRVFDSHDLTLSTKLKVYTQCLTPLLTYGCETWTLYRRNVSQLRTVQQRHLRKILRIKWSDHISNEEVLRRADTEDIEITLVKSRLRWLGHISRMEDERPVKSLLYGELDKGTRPVGRPNLRYKDTCKSVLKCGNILDRWQNMVDDRSLWRRTIVDVCGKLNEKRIASYQRRKEHRARKNLIVI